MGPTEIVANFIVETGYDQTPRDVVKIAKAQELLKRVAYVHPEGLTVKLKDGRELSHEVANPKGDPQNPMAEEEVAAEYRDCASLVLSPKDTQKSLEMVSHIEDLKDITELMDLLR
jgi:2-methylcitrate dehydratase PrpD